MLCHFILIELISQFVHLYIQMHFLKVKQFCSFSSIYFRIKMPFFNQLIQDRIIIHQANTKFQMVFHYNGHQIIKTLIAFLLMCAVSNSMNEKIYLTPNQSSIIIPFLKIDQTIYTTYIIEGTSVTIHSALERLLKYNQSLNVGKNIHGQSFIKIINAHQIFYVFYITPDYTLHYSLIKSTSIQQLAIVSLLFQLHHSDSLPRFLPFQGMEIVRENQVVLWTNRTMLVVSFSSENISTNDVRNYSHEILKIDMPSNLTLQLKKCKYFEGRRYLCHTSENILFVDKKKMNQAGAQQLVVQHILTPPQLHKCIINVERLQNSLIGMCDGQSGCFNYQIRDNQLIVVVHDDLLVLEEIVVMQLIDAAPKGATMVVASHDKLLLMKWGQSSISIADSMLLPNLQMAQLWHVEVSADNICLKFRSAQSSSNENDYKFQYIFIQYDSIRVRYDQLNIILNSPYIYPLYHILYNLEQNGQLSLRIFNPFYYLVDYEPNSRLITIKAFNTGSKTHNNTRKSTDFMQNQTVIYEIVSAIEGEIYINEQYVAEIDLNYQYLYPFELYQNFVGRIQSYTITQRQLPIQIQHSDLIQSWNSQNEQKVTVIPTSEDKRILSIYNVLECIGLVNSGSFSFNRLMTTSSINRVYIEECKSQKKENVGDFVCQVKQIVDKMTSMNELAQMNQIKMSFYFKRSQMKNSKTTSQDHSSWKMEDIGIRILNGQYSSQTVNNFYQIWMRKSSTEQDLQRQSFLAQYQYLIITKQVCIYLRGNRHSVTAFENQYILLSSVRNSTQQFISFTIFDTRISRIVKQIQIPHPLTQNISIVNIFVELALQNRNSRQYKIILSYLCANATKLIFITIEVPKIQGQDSMEIFGYVERRGELEGKSLYNRKYSHYLYSFNNTHVTKYLLFPINSKLTVLYTHALQLQLGNELIFVRNEGQYMLLVYSHSYRILDLNIELFGLVVDDKPIHEASLTALSNSGVYDMIVLGSETLLLGINNVMRSYDRKLQTLIGPYPIEQGQIRKYHSLLIQAIPSIKGKVNMSQAFNVTIHYETSQIQIRGKAIKMLGDLPYSANNQTLIIFENMFIGPIEQYYIIDVYDGGIQMLNHIEKIYDLSHVGQGKEQNKARNSINRWIKQESMEQIKKNNYSMLLYKQIDNPTNINDKNKHKFVYSNSTHILFLQLKTGEVEHIVDINEGKMEDFALSKFRAYCLIQYPHFALYVIYSNTKVLYLNLTRDIIQKAWLNIKADHELQIRELTITNMKELYSNGDIQEESKWVMFLSLKHAKTSSRPNNFAFVNLNENISEINFVCEEGSNSNQDCNIQYMTAINGILIYSKLSSIASSGSPDKLGENLQLCVQNAERVLQNKRQQYCKNMLYIVPPKYYIADIDSYYKLVPIYYQYDKGQDNHSEIIVKLLLLSKFDNSYHLQLLLTIDIKKSALLDDTYSCKWAIQNCFVSLSNYQAHQFISFYLNGTSFDYFILQYNILTQSNSQAKQSSKNGKDQQTILVFYRNNDDYSRCCGYVAGWVQVNQSQISNMLHISDPLYFNIPSQSLMFTTEQVFHVQKNLTFILNYQAPPSSQYAVIYTRNENFNNKFYSKLKYEPNPGQKYFWLYCWIGFLLVFLFLIALKIISLLIDRGIITWNKSLSSQDDSGGSPGATIHFISSGGMLTEDNNKSLSSP